MSYGIIRAKFVKQYESTRYNFQFCKSVKFLYSGVKKLYSERCHEEVFWGYSFKNLGKVYKHPFEKSRKGDL